MKCTFFSSASLVLLLFSALQAHAEEKNEVLDLSRALGTDQALTLPLTISLPLFDTRQAQRVLVRLPQDQNLFVLAMDRFGLKVRGEGKNGPITGWISQKAAFQNDQKALDSLSALYQRQQIVERLVLLKKVAVGMTLSELTRIMGPPTKHQISAETGNRLETLVWSRTGPVDLTESLEDSGLSIPAIHIVVEKERMTARLEEGVATVIHSDFEGSEQTVPEITPPVKHPFTTTLFTAR